MATTNERIQKLHRRLDALPEEELPIVERFLDFVFYQSGSDEEGMREEDRAWLDADLSNMGDVEPYDWGPDGPPKTKPIDYVPGVGLVVRGGKTKSER